MCNERINQLKEHDYVRKRENSWEGVFHASVRHVNPLSAVRRRVSELNRDDESRGGRFLRVSIGNNEDWFVKQYHRGGVLAERGDVTYASPERFLSELTGTVRAHELGISVPEPVGVFWKREGEGYIGFYVSEWVDARRVTQWLRDVNDADLMHRIGRILGRLHDGNIDHQDFKLDNLLIDDRRNVHVIDFEPVQIGNLNALKREQRLHRFLRFLSKHGFSPCNESSFLNGYRSETDRSTGPLFEALRLPNWIRNTGSDLLSSVRPQPLQPVHLEKILIRSPNWLGDCVLSLPFMQSLADELPETQIDVVCRKKVSSIFRACPNVNKVVTLKNQKSTQFPETVRGQRYSLALVLPKSFRTALQAWRSGIPRRRGFSTGLRAPLLTDRIPLNGKDRELHHARLYYELMSDVVDKPAQLPDVQLNVPDKWRSETPEPWYSGNYITIHPGSAYGPAKRWPPEQFKQFLQQFLAERDAGVTVLGVSSEKEIAEKVTEDVPEERLTDLVGETSLKQCMVVLEHSRATVANDSGLMHLTAALNTPVVSLFGSSSPELTSPLGNNGEVLYENVECSPCFEQKCPLQTDRYRCLTRISPGDVLDRLNSVLSRTT